MLRTGHAIPVREDRTTHLRSRVSNRSDGSETEAPERLLLLLFQGLGEGGDEVENIADDAIIGYLEDGGVGILVDGHDGAGTLHSHDVLDGAADAERQVELRRDGLAGAADLAIHRQPAFVADGAGSGQLAAEEPGQFLRPRDIF